MILLFCRDRAQKSPAAADLTVHSRSAGPLAREIVIGTVVSVASTTVLTRLLTDRGELQTKHNLVTVPIT